MVDAPATLILGAGGLVGSAIRNAVPGAMAPAGLPWSNPRALRGVLSEVMSQFARQAAERETWIIHWAAGSAVVASGSDALRGERASLEVFLDLLAQASLPRGGCLVLASSAGAVYAGAGIGPFDEASPVAPTSPYGEGKIASEAMAMTAAAGIGASCVVARIANVYGPRQDVSKPQGLISHLCRSAVTRRPLNLYVPLDTLRHYVFADDVGILLSHAGVRGAILEKPANVVKIVSGGPPVTVGRLIYVTRRIARRPLPVSYGMDPAGVRQPPDLRLRSTIWTDLDPLAARTDLVAGVKKVFDATITGVARAVEPVAPAA